MLTDLQCRKAKATDSPIKLSDGGGLHLYVTPAGGKSWRYSKTLVSQQSIDNAIDLQNRYDAAVSILETRWHPIQDILTNLGMKLRGIWVDIVSEIAKAVDYVIALALKIYDVLSPILNVVAAIDKLALKAAVVGSGTEAAYRRRTALANRRKLMDEWTTYCVSERR
ncbi:Arm DNA-binding domain-containing protein [Bradyrhizobium sp. USDA 4451]